MNDLISVIVPIYKVEKYLDKCIESIINQTYYNLEIILVDDGSPDKCGEICDKYALQDDRIVVIHKENGGLSDARNKGLKVSTGKFISFIDSDDFISVNYFEYLYSLLKKYNADISVVLPYKFSNYDEIKINNTGGKVTVYNASEALITMLYQKKFDNAAWGKLYKKDVVKNIEFPVGKLYEDIGTTYKYLLNSKKVVFGNERLYYYLQRNDSIMGKPFRIQEMDYIYQSKILLDDVSKIGNKKLIEAAECRYVNANFSVLLKIKRNSLFIEQRKEIIKNIKKISFKILFNANSRFKTKVAIIMLYLRLL